MPRKKKINKTLAVLNHLRSYKAISKHRARTHYTVDGTLPQIIEGIKKRHLKCDELVRWDESTKQYKYFKL